MNRLKRLWYMGNPTVVLLIVVLIASLWAMSGCQSSAPQQPEPMEPDTIDTPTVEPEEPDEPETPDQVFCREWDACWKVYTDCQKTMSKDECFPAMQDCGVAAYRKLKKARGEG